MDDKSREILRVLMKKFAELSYIRPEDIPDIPLYMDQITSFMEGKLESCKRYPEDKILTKTMINNYTKNRLIPPPEKKKYSKDHLVLLIFTYYLKDFLSISDISSILKPLEDNLFNSGEEPSIDSVYQEVCSLIKDQTPYMTRDLMRRWKMSEHFSEESGFGESNKEYLRMFAFICLLSFDVYVKKKLIEAAVDAFDSGDKTS